MGNMLNSRGGYEIRNFSDYINELFYSILIEVICLQGLVYTHVYFESFSLILLTFSVSGVAELCNFNEKKI